MAAASNLRKPGFHNRTTVGSGSFDHAGFFQAAALSACHLVIHSSFITFFFFFYQCLLCLGTMLAHFLMTLDAKLPHGIGSGCEMQIVLLLPYKPGPSLFKDLSTDM